MKIDYDSGWLDGVRRVESPNCDARPRGCVPELIVIHGISLPPGEFGGPGIDEISDSIHLDSWAVEPVGPDLMLSAYVHRDH